MAIPSGSGTEIIKTATLHNQSNSQSDIFGSTVGSTSTAVPANHIYIVLSITFQEMGGVAEHLYLRVNNGSNDIYLSQISLPASKCFVWNDKFAVAAGHSLRTTLDSSGNVDVYCTYIDQDWT